MQSFFIFALTLVSVKINLTGVLTLLLSCSQETFRSPRFLRLSSMGLLIRTQLGSSFLFKERTSDLAGFQILKCFSKFLETR